MFLHLQVRLEGGSFRLEEVDIFGSEVALARQLDSFEVSVKLLQLLLECVELAVRSQHNPERTVALISCARNQTKISLSPQLLTVTNEADQPSTTSTRRTWIE